MRRELAAIGLVAAALPAGCNTREANPAAPPRVATAPALPQTTSTLVVPVSLSLATLAADLDARLPRRLWSIDERKARCVGGQHVKAFGLRLKVTPDLSCRIVGEVTRGSLRLSGAGQRLDIVMPVTAAISARNVAGVLHGTATGSALVRTTAVLGVTGDWTPTATVRIAYDWTDPPGIDFLGQRISIASRADAKLAGVVARLERALRGEIGRVKLRPAIERAWRQGFTVIELNRARPPAWMRITPLRAGVLGYTVRGDAVELTAAAEARTETFVGRAPAPNPPTPLPPRIGAIADRGLRFAIPVLADYDQLEPVVLRALRKLDARGIALPSIGRVRASFGGVTIYATAGNRIAVGIDAEVAPAEPALRARWGKARGRVWLTALPVSAADSEVVRFQDLRIFGRTDRTATDLLLQLASSDGFRAGLAASLTQNFANDYGHVLDAARRAIVAKRVGDFTFTASADSVHHDPVSVTGAGLFMPVTVTGAATVRFSPRG